MSKNKIEANINLGITAGGMSTAKQFHAILQPQVIPNLLEHSQKRETEGNHASVVIGTLLGTLDGKLLEVSNSFPMTLIVKKKSDGKDEKSGKESGKANEEPEYIIDTEYLKKMVKFYKTINEQESVLGYYISSTKISKLTMVIYQYFTSLFKDKVVKTAIQSPIMLMFDPTLEKNKLDIKVMTLHSLFMPECPYFSEIPYKFKLQNFDKTGLDVLFYGQEHFDTMSILDGKRVITQENFAEYIKNQKILGDRQLMLKNFRQLIENLSECEEYI